MDEFPHYSAIGGITTRNMNLNKKMGTFELVQQPLSSLPGQHQVKELFTVIEAAESAIRNQMQENEHLRCALRVTEWELQNRKLEKHGVSQQLDGQNFQSLQVSQVLPSADRQGLLHTNGYSAGNKNFREDQQSFNPQQYPGSHVSLIGDGQHRSGQNGISKGLNDGGTAHLQPAIDLGGSLVASSRSMSPSGHGRDTNLEARPEAGTQGLGQIHSDPSTHKGHQQQELALRNARMYEEELGQLRSRLTESSVKEAQLLSGKRILERRVAELRLAYDQQQQTLVDAASKALSYRQDVLEENIRLTYALQASDQERSVYVSSLMPLLAEFDLQTTVTDAHSIASAVKILVQHLRSELSLSEMQSKNKDPQFGPTWRKDLMYKNAGKYAKQSPPHPKFHGLEIVPQHSYSEVKAAQSPTSPTNRNWGSSTSSQYPAVSNHHIQYSDSETNYVNHSQPANHELHESNIPQRHSDASETDDLLGSGTIVQNNRDEPERLEPVPRYPHSPSSHLPTLQDEDSLSPSQDGDPLPAISGLQIVGHAVLSGRLTACGHSINGTALCMFQWVRHYQNGTTTYIEGAAQPEYTVTADDCDSMVAIECVPMDDRNRRGELVTVFANDSRWITCDAMMHDQIDNYNAAGHASFEVQLVVDGSSEEVSESGVLTLKRSSYELRRNGSTRRVVAGDKYSSDVSIKVPVGHLIQCVITNRDHRQFELEFRDNRTRDAAVLTFRLFQKMALEGKRGRRRSLPWLR